MSTIKMASTFVLEAESDVDCVVCRLPRQLDAISASSLAALLDARLRPRGGPARALVAWDARDTTFDFEVLDFCGAVYRAVDSVQRGRAAAHVVLAPDGSRTAAFVAALLLVYEPATPCYVAASLSAAAAAAPLVAALLPRRFVVHDLDDSPLQLGALL